MPIDTGNATGVPADRGDGAGYMRSVRVAASVVNRVVARIKIPAVNVIDESVAIIVPAIG